MRRTTPSSKRWGCVLVVLGLVVASCSGTAETATTAAQRATTTTRPATTTTTTEPGYPGLVLDAGGCDYGGLIRSIEAVDELTVRFDLCEPHPGFLAQLALPVLGIQSQENLEATGGAPLRNPIGTGPYRFSEWNGGDSIVFERFEDYYGEHPEHDTAVLTWAPDSAGRLAELQEGGADGVAAPAPADYESIDGDENVVVVDTVEPNVFYLGFTNSFSPWNDVRVRKAVALAIDRQRIVDRFYPPGSETASHYTPCSVENGCQGLPWHEFDVEQARALLAEAGIADGFETKIYYRDVPLGYLLLPNEVAADIQAQLKEHLNIDAELVVMESSSFAERSAAGGLNGIHLRGWTGDYPHVTNFLDPRFARTSLQFGNPYPEIYGPLEAAAAMTDPSAAAPLYREANNAIRELVPLVPVAHGARTFAAGADVDGAYAPAWGNVRLDRWDNGTDTLTFVQRSEPASLYCADETDADSLRACAQVVEGLYSYGPTGEVQPQLATGCVPSDTLDEWTCSLRSGVLFHDGTTLDANDVVTSLAVGLDASHPLHTGNTGLFEYYAYLWDGLINTPTDP